MIHFSLCRDSLKRDLERLIRDLDNTKSNLDATTKEKERYNKESALATRRISDFEIVIQRVQEENSVLKRDLNASQGKLGSLQKVVERATANHDKVVNEAKLYKESADRFENEVLIFKEETNNYQSQVSVIVSIAHTLWSNNIVTGIC